MSVQQLIREMRETLREAGGVGLAAPQVFESRRLFLAALERPKSREDLEEVEVFINPVVTPLSEERESAWEGCLSFLELTVLVPRYVSVRVEYWNEVGEVCATELTGFPARVIQHEHDHLDGVLTIDRALSTRDIIKSSEFDAATATAEE